VTSSREAVDAEVMSAFPSTGISADAGCDPASQGRDSWNHGSRSYVLACAMAVAASSERIPHVEPAPALGGDT